MSTTTKITLAAVAVVALGIGAYLVFFTNTDGTSALSAQTAPASAAEISFLDLAQKAESVSFDTSILSDPRFQALVDIHTAIVPEPQGRTDPFAVLPGTSSTGN
jgi:hypothetical protein